MTGGAAGSRGAAVPGKDIHDGMKLDDDMNSSRGTGRPYFDGCWCSGSGGGGGKECPGGGGGVS